MINTFGIVVFLVFLGIAFFFLFVSKVHQYTHKKKRVLQPHTPYKNLPEQKPLRKTGSLSYRVVLGPPDAEMQEWLRELNETDIGIDHDAYDGLSPHEWVTQALANREPMPEFLQNTPKRKTKKR